MKISRIPLGINQRQGLALLLLFAGPLAVGCGEGGTATTQVSGNVSHEGKPLDRGVILFNPVDGDLSPSRSNIRPDGTYELLASPGKYKVIVNLYAEANSDVEMDDPRYKEPKPLLPLKYSSLTRTPLEFTVNEKGPQVIDLEL